MKKALIAARAREDVRDHIAFLDSKRRGYGRRFLLAFQNTVRQIERSPESIAFYGFRASDIADVRVAIMMHFEKWMVLFRVAGKDIEILRVLHGSRDIEALEDEILPK